ncbi:hypothetical protein [Synechococcus sp. MU1611]|uniref:hypothetical protein n=1 Tax=Synechococcus sp. MU1611 TaxID=2508345 RepID=UPI001CF7EF59|nr:hypothetical protein [Synechococcus sp. MU1611]MCB4411494.1 hypothetical protein [Synechococcus sp. MU1611]
MPGTVPAFDWVKRYPVFWINLQREPNRCKRMRAALSAGNWKHCRWNAIDGSHPSHHFWARERPWQQAATLPGLQRDSEADPHRRTNRNELACLCSWQQLIESLSRQTSPSGWFLLMEDDVGSSLAEPMQWPVLLDDIVNQAGSQAMAIQLAPINGGVREMLYQRWKVSEGSEVVVPKEKVRSHGNGAVLLHENAVPLLSRRIGQWIEQWFPQLHLLGHPLNVRPVADKWLYASLPPGSCWVSTFPLFCLEAETSSLHQEHVTSFHQASRNMTLKLWREGGHRPLLDAYEAWQNG